MSLRIHQIVFAAQDLDTTVAQFTRVLGLQVCHRDPGVATFGLQNALLHKAGQSWLDRRGLRCGLPDPRRA